MEAQACMQAAWRRTMHLNLVDHCGVTVADVQLILASIELHQPPATSWRAPARRSLQDCSFFCSPFFNAVELIDDRHGS